MRVRSLYDCGHARVDGQAIRCDAGHALSQTKAGTLELKRAARGDGLTLRVCQLCRDFDEMGPPLPAGEQGWAEVPNMSADVIRLNHDERHA